MSVPLSDAQLAATARRIANAMFAGLMPGETGSNMANEIAERVTAPYVDAVERLRAELAQARTEPIVARWSKGVTHHDAGTTVECVDADDNLRGISLELTIDDREALGLSLVDPDGEMDQPTDAEDETLRDAWREVREALIYGASTAAVLDLMDEHDRAAMLALADSGRQADDTTSKEA
jgi:hypothetical protein